MFYSQVTNRSLLHIDARAEPSNVMVQYPMYDAWGTIQWFPLIQQLTRHSKIDFNKARSMIDTKSYSNDYLCSTTTRVPGREMTLTDSLVTLHASHRRTQYMRSGNTTNTSRRLLQETRIVSRRNQWHGDSWCRLTHWPANATYDSPLKHPL